MFERLENKVKYIVIGILATKRTNLNNKNKAESKIKQSYLFETPEYKVVSRIKRDNTIFTQGFFLDTNNTFIESGGLYSKSMLQRTHLNNPFDVIQKFPLEDKFFGEGATLFKNKIYQLTWREGKM